MYKKMHTLKTALNFIMNIRTTGALYETSNKSNLEVTKYVKTDAPQIIVEFGGGHGNITKAILAKMNKYSTLYVFEINKHFCSLLKEIKDERLVIINDSAHCIDNYVTEEVDCIISTIPFSLISNNILDQILLKSKRKLKNDGTISQILYSVYHLNKYKKYFKNVSYKTILSFPLEYVYHCGK
jgi:phospholipid N-methyltransferase